MTRTLLLAALAVAGIAAAFLLPRRYPAPLASSSTPPAPAPGAGSLTLTARPARQAFLAGGDDLDLVYELQAAHAVKGARSPVDFALVLDRSGSMTGEPLAKAKEAARSLVARLAPDDRLALVNFGSDARLSLATTPMDAAGKARALEEIDRIAADGGTNIGQALLAALHALDDAGRREKAVRRMVLLSDGQANEGLVGPSLIQLARTIDRDGTRVSALGLGVDFDEDLMLALADAGGGRYRYLRDADEVESALAQELEQASATAASGVTLSLQLPEGVELRELVGYRATTSRGNRLTLALSDFAAGERRRVVVRVHARAGHPGERTLARAQVDYTDALAHHPAQSRADAVALATNDPSRIAASYDRDAAKAGLQARLGQSLAQAAHLYQNNDSAGATRAVDGTLGRLQQEAQALGDVGFSARLAAEGQQAEALLQAAPAPSAAGRASTKSLKAFGTAAARR